MKFRNPQNGYVESASVPLLWCLLFGSFYFIFKGNWVAAIFSFILAFCTFGISWLIFPLFASEIVYKKYMRKGWERVK